MFEIEDGFRVERWIKPHVFVALESARLPACIDFARKIGADGVYIARYFGFSESGLQCLRDLEFVKALYVREAWPDWSPIAGMRQLRWLQIDGEQSKVGLDVSALQQLVTARFGWWPRLTGVSALKSLERLFLASYRPKRRDFAELAGLERLHELEVVGTSIKSLQGLESCRSLRELAILGCRSLVDTSALRALADQLDSLSLNQCRRIDPIADIQHLQNLRGLSYHCCADIPSLQFLDGLPKLESFRAIATRIVDGDMRPLFRLRQVIIEDAKHHSHKLKEILQAGAQGKVHGERSDL